MAGVALQAGQAVVGQPVIQGRELHPLHHTPRATYIAIGIEQRRSCRMRVEQVGQWSAPMAVAPVLVMPAQPLPDDQELAPARAGRWRRALLGTGAVLLPLAAVLALAQHPQWQRLAWPSPKTQATREALAAGLAEPAPAAAGCEPCSPAAGVKAADPVAVVLPPAPPVSENENQHHHRHHAARHRET